MQKLKHRYLLISVLVLLFFAGIGFLIMAFDFISNEESEKYSAFDEVFINQDSSIALSSSDLAEIQSEVLNYISGWKDVDALLYVNVYLDTDLNLSSIVFAYQLNDVNDYTGRLEVKCDTDGRNWKMLRAESIYHYVENSDKSGDGSILKDMFLEQKILEVVKFIESREEPRVDLYLIKINGDNIHIDAHNVEDNNMDNNWREDCLVHFDEDSIHIETKNA